MIKVTKRPPFEALVENHPPQTGNNSVSYTINHNRNGRVKYIYAFHGVDLSSERTGTMDRGDYGGNAFGYFWGDSSVADQLNQLRINVYRLGSSTADLRFFIITEGD